MDTVIIAEGLLDAMAWRRAFSAIRIRYHSGIDWVDYPLDTPPQVVDTPSSPL